MFCALWIDTAWEAFTSLITALHTTMLHAISKLQLAHAHDISSDELALRNQRPEDVLESE